MVVLPYGTVAQHSLTAISVLTCHGFLTHFAYCVCVVKNKIQHTSRFAICLPNLEMHFLYSTYPPTMYYPPTPFVGQKLCGRVFIYIVSAHPLLQSCQVLPTTVLDSSDSLTLTFQSWEDPGFLGRSRDLPFISLSTSCPCYPEDPLDILRFLGHPGILPSSPSHTAVWRILWTSRDPPFKSLSHSCLGFLGHPGILHVPLTQLPHAVW